VQVLLVARTGRSNDFPFFTILIRTILLVLVACSIVPVKAWYPSDRYRTYRYLFSLKFYNILDCFPYHRLNLVQKQKQITFRKNVVYSILASETKVEKMTILKWCNMIGQLCRINRLKYTFKLTFFLSFLSTESSRHGDRPYACLEHAQCDVTGSILLPGYMRSMF
jgi:hypothetical protein